MSDSLRPHGLYPTRLPHPWDFLGKNTGVGCHFLLQGIFLTHGSNPCLLYCRQTLYHLSHQSTDIKKKYKYVLFYICYGIVILNEVILLKLFNKWVNILIFSRNKFLIVREEEYAYVITEVEIEIRSIRVNL